MRRTAQFQRLRGMKPEDMCLQVLQMVVGGPIRSSEYPNLRNREPCGATDRSFVRTLGKRSIACLRWTFPMLVDFGAYKGWILSISYRPLGNALLHKPSPQTHQVVLNVGCRRERKPKLRSLATLAATPRAFQNCILCNAAMNACAKSSNWHAALAILEDSSGVWSCETALSQRSL